MTTSRPGEEKLEFIDLQYCAGSGGREDFQRGWQQFVGQQFDNMSIIDVGAGLGLSKERLEVNGNVVTLQDIAMLHTVDTHDSIAVCADDDYAIATCFDVIEHVRKDEEFVHNLLRIAWHRVIITTPNWRVSQAVNPHHVREYDPQGLFDLISDISEVISLRDGDALGKKISGDLPEQKFFDSIAPHLYIEVQP